MTKIKDLSEEVTPEAVKAQANKDWQIFIFHSKELQKLLGNVNELQKNMSIEEM